MWQSLFKVALNPEFTPGFKRFIREQVTPAMQNDDDISGKSGQYEIGLIQESMDDSNEKFDNQDLMVMTKLHKESIEFVEL
jgi:hypothetical protein